MTRIAIAGAGGRMGRELILALEQTTEAKLTAALERTGSSLIGADAAELVGLPAAGVKITDALSSVLDEFDVLIDFSSPAATLAHLAYCESAGKKMVIGTTGFTDTERARIAQTSTALVIAANYSVGVNLMLNLLKQAATVMGEESDIEIVEAHHRYKVDAPSGTALAMGEAIASAMGNQLADVAVFSREGRDSARKPNEIGFATIRAGDIVGEHTAIFADIGERIEISHKATSRMTFAKGAVRAAIWITAHKQGAFSMQDVLRFTELQPK